MRILAPTLLSIFLATIGCGVPTEEQLEAPPPTSASTLTLSERQVISVPGQQIPRSDDPTVEDHNGKWCTFNCGAGCFQAAAVTWGHCDRAAHDLGCWNARWCRPHQCCP